MAFVPYESPEYYSLYVSVSARHKSGKTHFGLTSPRPIAFINFDNGLEGVAEKFDMEEVRVLNVEKELEEASILFEEGVAQIRNKFGDNEPDKGYKPKAYRDAEKIWRDVYLNVKPSYIGALKDEEIRTVVVDGGDKLLRLQRYFHFGTNRPLQVEYGMPNDLMETLLRMPLTYNKNFVILNRMEKEYVQKNPNKFSEGANWTGNYISKQFKELPYIAQVNVMLWIGDGEEDTTTPYLQILDCRLNKDVNGYEMKGDDEGLEGGVNFLELARVIYPDSSPEDWGY